MIDLKRGVAIALPLVVTKKKHQDYEHVCYLSEKLYRPLITGKDIGHLIEQFNKREDAEAYAQRLRLTQVISPAITNTLIAPARKVPKVKPNVNRADYGPDLKEKTEKLNTATSNFFGGKNVDHFLGSVLLDAGAIDPNAFCLIHFDNYDFRFEDPQVYPTLITCHDAWHFEYANGILQWLWVHRDITYLAKEEQAEAKKKKATDPPMVEKKGHWFCLYLNNEQVMFKQVDARTIQSAKEGMLIDAKSNVVPGFDGSDKKPSPTFDATEKYYFRVGPEELYEVVFYQHNSKAVQAFRIGYKYDQVTDGRTCVNLWQPSMPFLMKGLKAGSELDISAALHAFLQKIQFANPCKGFTDEHGAHWDCRDGYLPDGKTTCKKCGGSGYDVHTSGQDHITLRMPKPGEDPLDIAKMIHYVPLPVEVLEWQDKYVDKLEAKCYRALYNTDRFRQDQVQATATGEVIDLQSVYDALQPFADWYSQNRVLIYKLTAIYVNTSKDYEKLVVQHEFPRNMRFETLEDLIRLKKALKEAGASAAQMIQVDRMLNEHLFVDDEVGLKRVTVMTNFDPFAGKDEGTIVSLISQDLSKHRLKVLWFNMNYVFPEAEERCADRTPPVDFYDLTRAEQQKLLDEIVDEIIAEQEARAEEQQAKLSLGVVDDTGETSNPDAPTPDGPTQKANPDMPASPGNQA